MIESSASDPSRVAPLPNLDRHIRVGDALTGDDLTRARFPGAPAMTRLRARYARAVGTRKRTLARTLDRAERSAAIASLDRRIVALTDARRDALIAARGRDLFGGRSVVPAGIRSALEELRSDLRAARAKRRALENGAALPFSFTTHFADVAASGGFDVIVGNPPWVRVHRIAPDTRAQLRRDFASYRGAAWQQGATAARAGIGFAGQVDLAALFIERSLAVTRTDGVVALLVPAKLWRSLAGGGVRRLVSDDHRLLAVDDWSEAPSLFDAAVYPSVVVVRRGRRPVEGPPAETRVTVRASRVAVAWAVHACEFAVDDTPGAPWLMLPPQARRAFDAVRRVGMPLGTSAFGAPLLGVKCGCNGAFVVRANGAGDLIGGSGNIADVEREMLRPLIRGEHMSRWRVGDTGEQLIWTHGADGLPLDRLPPRTERWLRSWRRRLMARSDARGNGRWWSLFRTEAAAHDVARVIWADFGREPRAAVLLPDDKAVPLNTCYAARCRDPRDAFALAAILNSALAHAWLAAVAEPARGGYRRYLGWTLSMLPLPNDWARARNALADAAEQAANGNPPCDADLLAVVVRAYGLRRSVVAPLLDWSLR